MRFLVDTNVIIDIAQRRRPWAKDCAAFVRIAGKSQRDQLFTAWHSVSNVAYILSKGAKKKFSLNAITMISKFSDVPPGTNAQIDRALELDFTDFEDALQVAVAELAQVDFIVTRNQDDFKKSPIPVLSPEEALEMIEK